ncbi:MAG: Gfo/Idh/MocA family oxidoreductase [Planctomycetaceae bacterium]|jgi:predicted dehydrogenase|nr:Gfo/Idh/MocA family oxidoreductase [Planctomycetaceae bacterium]
MTDKSDNNTNTNSDANVLSELSRREFIVGGVVAVGVPAISTGAFYFAYKMTGKHPIRVGVVGTGDEGQVLLGAINPEYIEVKSIADIRPYNQYRTFYGDCYSPTALKVRPGLNKVYGWDTESEARRHIKVYTDYRELIKNAKADGIEAIIIGLPLHLHHAAAVCAMKAGLHVLTEKLMGHSVAKCKEMARVAYETKKHLATGHQRHYNILYQEAVDTIRRGLIGNIHYIRAQWHRNNAPGNDSWQMPMPAEIKRTDSLAQKLNNELKSWTDRLNKARGVEIEEWSKKVAQKKAQIADHVLASGGQYLQQNIESASNYGYEDGKFAGSGEVYDRPAAEELLRWRLWRRTGGGLMVELGSHQLDAASIFLAANNDLYLDQNNSPKLRGEKVHPLRVHVSANRNLFQLDREANDHITTLVEFPAPDYDPSTRAGEKRKICVQYSTVNGNGFGGYGEVVYGTDGTLILRSENESEIFRSGDSGGSKVAARADAALDTQSSGPAQTAVGGAAKAEVSRGYQEELEHWAWCIRVNPDCRDEKLQPRCTPKIALGDSVIALVTNIASDTGKSVTFNESWFDPLSDATPEVDVAQDNTAVINMQRPEYSL